MNIYWRPFRDLVGSRNEFAHRFAASPIFGVATEGESGTPAWTPAVDIYETEGNLIFRAELPGVDPSQVQVGVENNQLYLKGERKFASGNGTERMNYQQVESTYGPFARSFVLPRSVDAEKITAEYKDGLLVVSIPKRAEAKPRAIDIKVA